MRSRYAIPFLFAGAIAEPAGASSRAELAACFEAAVVHAVACGVASVPFTGLAVSDSTVSDSTTAEQRLSLRIRQLRVAEGLSASSSVSRSESSDPAGVPDPLAAALDDLVELIALRSGETAMGDLYRAPAVLDGPGDPGTGNARSEPENIDARLHAAASQLGAPGAPGVRAQSPDARTTIIGWPIEPGYFIVSPESRSDDGAVIFIDVPFDAGLDAVPESKK